MDKANVRTVVHLSPPSSVEAYLQESGRASRDGKGANAWLIWTPEDLNDSDYLRDSSTIDPASKVEVVARLRRAAMVRYASSTDNCRREMLLDALGIEAQDCSGCDVCGGEPWAIPPEEKLILKVVR